MSILPFLKSLFSSAQQFSTRDRVNHVRGGSILTGSGLSAFDARRSTSSDITLVSCTLNSDAHMDRQLTLAPLQVALPLVGDRLWAFGYRHHDFEAETSRLTPLVS